MKIHVNNLGFIKVRKKFTQKQTTLLIGDDVKTENPNENKDKEYRVFRIFLAFVKSIRWYNITSIESNNNSE